MRDQIKQEADTNLKLMRYIKLVNLGDGGWGWGILARNYDHNFERKKIGFTIFFSCFRSFFPTDKKSLMD